MANGHNYLKDGVDRMIVQVGSTDVIDHCKTGPPGELYSEQVACPPHA